MPEGYCESMCVFLLLGGATREISPQAHIRVHQIWMGDRASDAKAAKYSADDMTIVERDVGRLAKYTFEMGGSGDLLALALSVPPWEPLHELSAAELVSSNLIAASAVADNVLKGCGAAEGCRAKGCGRHFGENDSGSRDQHRWNARQANQDRRGAADRRNGRRDTIALKVRMLFPLSHKGRGGRTALLGMRFSPALLPQAPWPLPRSD